jgi:hypothetical protein
MGTFFEHTLSIIKAAFEHTPSIIEAASKNDRGVIVLIILALASVGVLFFWRAQQKVRLVMFPIMFLMLLSVPLILVPLSQETRIPGPSRELALPRDLQHVCHERFAFKLDVRRAPHCNFTDSHAAKTADPGSWMCIIASQPGKLMAFYGEEVKAHSSTNEQQHFIQIPTRVPRNNEIRLKVAWRGNDGAECILDSPRIFIPPQ